MQTKMYSRRMSYKCSCYYNVIHIVLFRYGVKVEDKFSSPSPVAIKAVAVGKIKEKLENVGLALLSIALSYSNPMSTWGKTIL